jgi:hypothetical protein
MNLFELNARMAVKLNQSFDTLYNLEWLEYSLLLNIINKDIEEENDRLTEIEKLKDSNNSPLKVNLPSHLNLK